MPKLFVEKSIEINAHAHHVWNALTQAEQTRQWIGGFGLDGEMVSDWQLNSAVLWKNNDGTIIVEGRVTALEPERLLRFTVFDVRSEKPPVTPEDGITYQLSENGGRTTLHIRQGDFSAMPDGEKFRDRSAQIWDRVLVKVKEIAEILEMQAEPTCGKGVALNSGMSQKVGNVMAAMADMLAAHMTALDLSDPAAKVEYDAYDSLVKKYRGIAAQLAATAAEMNGYYSLPIAQHDMDVMSQPQMRDTFEKLVKEKQALLDLLQKTTAEDQHMLDEW